MGVITLVPYLYDMDGIDIYVYRKGYYEAKNSTFIAGPYVLKDYDRDNGMYILDDGDEKFVIDDSELLLVLKEE
jgi:hypothetical protein